MVPSRLQIVFLYILVVVEAPDLEIPNTADAPVLESELILLLLILTEVDVFVHTMPVTAHPVPVDDRLLITLSEILSRVAPEKVLPTFIAVIAPWPVILLKVLFDTLEVDAPI